jgi:hypothetical protein
VGFSIVIPGERRRSASSVIGIVARGVREGRGDGRAM